MSLLALPDEVITAVASQLPPGQRHSSFSLAHSRLQAAADQATNAQPVFRHTFSLNSKPSQQNDDDYDDYDDARDCPDHRQECCEHFGRRWLRDHGQHLTKLKLTNFNKGFKELPPQLKELELHGCAARWHAPDECGVTQTFGYATCSGGSRDMLRELTSLTKLHMGCCAYTYNTPRQVAAATSLQHLTWSHPALELASCVMKNYPTVMEDGALKHLTNLTHLEFRCISPSWRTVLCLDYSEFSNPLQYLSRLVKLQTLIIDTGRMSALMSAGFQGLKHLTNITHLELTCQWECQDYRYEPAEDDPGNGATPWLSSLTALQSLTLKHLSIEPSKLHGLSRLAHLHLHECTFNPSHLLALLGTLTQLQQLHILQECEGCSKDELAWPPAGPAYAG